MLSASPVHPRLADNVATYLDVSGHATEEIDCLLFYGTTLAGGLPFLVMMIGRRRCANSPIRRRQLVLNFAAATYLFCPKCYPLVISN
jgi:hypothetical protein